MKTNKRLMRAARAIASDMHSKSSDLDYAGLYLELDFRGRPLFWIVASEETPIDQLEGYYAVESRDFNNDLGTFFGPAGLEYTVKQVYDYLVSQQNYRGFELTEFDQFSLRSNFFTPKDMRQINKKLDEHPLDLAFWSYDDEIVCETIVADTWHMFGPDLIIFNPLLQAAELAGFLGSRETAEFLIFDGKIPHLHFQAIDHVCKLIGATWETEGCGSNRVGMFHLPKWK